MNFVASLQSELDTQLRLQKIYTDRLASMPEGSLWTKRRKDGDQYYLKLSGMSPQYLHKKDDLQMISELKAKKHLIDNLCRLNNNIALITELSTKYVPLVCDNISEHLDFTESQNPVYPETLIHNTSFGLKVRSKSEAMIADSLYMFNVPLLYEQKLVLTDAFGQPYDIYPDFTITLSDGSSIYWEHKGRMDDSKYRQRNQWKESLYFINGIYPPHNLISTMDGPNQEYDLQEIHRVIKGLILPRLGK